MFYSYLGLQWGFPGGSERTDRSAMLETHVRSLDREDPLEREWLPTPVFLPGEPQGQKSLVGCRLWGRTESDTTEVT